MFKKILAIVAVLLTISLVISNYFGESDAEKTITAQGLDNPLIINGLGVEITNANSTNETKNAGVLRVTNDSDVLNVKVTNVGRNRELILKLFYDYKEVAFKVKGEENYKKEFVFNLDDTNEINLPIQLSKEIKKDNSTHKLLVAIYPSPKVHEKNEMARTSSSNIIMNYDIVYNQNERTKIHNQYEVEKPSDVFKIPYAGVVINDDIKNESKDLSYVKYPPYYLKGKKGEELDLAYTAGGYSDSSHYLLLLTVGWKQWEMDQQPFKVVHTEQSKLGHGTFKIKAPDEVGLYEVIAYIVKNPFALNNENSFSPIDSSYRFTLEVENE